MAGQPSLFEEPEGPSGFRYRDDIVSADEERALAATIAGLDLRPFDFHGFAGNRRTVSFGWRYDFGRERLEPAEPMPAFLLPLRDRAAGFMDLEPEAVIHALVTEYAPGAGIGWHRDKRHFDRVAGVSLLAPCELRFRQRTAEGFRRMRAALSPRSIYLLDGEARSDWEHSILPMAALRYSITFRSRR